MSSKLLGSESYIFTDPRWVVNSILPLLSIPQIKSGWYKCKSCSLDKNNIFGFYSDRYLEFDHWIESVAYYKKWQDKYMPIAICNNDEYLIWLKEFGYFTDENYIKKVNDIKEYEESLYN